MIKWIKDNDIMSKALSLACAVMLWFYVVSSTNLDMSSTYSNMPVELYGIENLTANNLAIVGGDYSTVSFKVSGKSERIAMLSGKEGLTVTADLSNITMPGTYEVKYQVASNVSDLTINKITPVITLEIDRLVSKSVPVDLTISGTLPDNYVSDDFVLSPDAITVKGPQKLLDSIVSAVASFDISELKSSTETTLSYTLVDKAGEKVESNLITVDSPSVKLTYGVRQTGKIPFMVSVDYYGFIDNDMVDIVLEHDGIKVSGAPDVMSTLNRIELGEISLEHMFENDSFEAEFPVILPNGITAEEDITTVKVNVVPKGIVKTEIVIPKEKLPESSVFTYTDNLRVTVWTTESNKSSLSPESLDISITFLEENLVPGINHLPVTVTPADDEVIVIGDYSVDVEAS